MTKNFMYECMDFGPLKNYMIQLAHKTGICPYGCGIELKTFSNSESHIHKHWLEITGGDYIDD